MSNETRNGSPEGAAGIRVWPVQDAKARFSELLDASLKDGPQIISRRGVETAVLVPVGEWRRIRFQARRSLKDLLLAPEARTETLTPPRRQARHRSPPRLD